MPFEKTQFWGPVTEAAIFELHFVEPNHLTANKCLKKVKMKHRILNYASIYKPWISLYQLFNCYNFMELWIILSEVTIYIRYQTLEPKFHVCFVTFSMTDNHLWPQSGPLLALGPQLVYTCNERRDLLRMRCTGNGVLKWGLREVSLHTGRVTFRLHFLNAVCQHGERVKWCGLCGTRAVGIRV